jgi:hypothetical protein
MEQPTTPMEDENTSLSAIQKVGWGGRNLVRWDQFPKYKKIGDYHCNAWLGLDRQATQKELEETLLTLTRLKSRLKREINQEIKKHYVEHLKLYLPSETGREIGMSWQKVMDIYATTLGTYELHHAYWKVMYQSWAYPTDLETRIQEAIKKATGWEYTTIVDDRRRGFIRIIITEVKSKIHRQLRTARRKKFEDVVRERAGNRPDLDEDTKKQLNGKPRKEKRKFDSNAIFGYEFMGRIKSGGVKKGTFLRVDKDSENRKLRFRISELERQIGEINNANTPPLDVVDTGSGQGFISTLETSSVGQTGVRNTSSLSVGSGAEKPIATGGKLHPNMVCVDTPTSKKLTTVLLDDATVHSEIDFLETAVQKAQDINPYVSLLHDEPQAQEREGDVNTSALAAVVKNVARGDGDTIETEETDETETTVEGRVHSNMVSFIPIPEHN